jgi:hypothetical protein
MADFNFGGINSLLRNLPGSAQQITKAISRGFGSVPSATRQLPPGAASMRQGLPNATVPSPQSVRFNPAANLPYPPQTPLFEERLYNATRTGLTNARNAVGAAVDTGRGVANILGRAAGPSMEAIQGGLGSAGGTISNMAGGARNALGAAVDTGRGVANIVGRGAGPALSTVGRAAMKVGPLAAYSIPGFAETRDANARYVIDTAQGLLADPSRGGFSTSPRVSNLPKDYAYQERLLAAQARADQIGRGGSGAGGSVGGGNMGGFIPPGATSTPFANPAAERAYQSERSSVAQQAAQNPELQRYQDQAILARQALQGYDPASGPLPGAAQQAQDMGMAMWAKANPGLAAKVRPGQSGFGAIQNTLASSAATAGLQMPGQLTPTPQIPGTTTFPTAIPQSGFQVPGAPAQDQLSSYPQFDPKKVDIGLFSKFMQANPKK